MRISNYLIAVFALSITCTSLNEADTSKDYSALTPIFEVDPFWPKPLPDNWLIGQVSGVAVDSEDNVWIIHRPGSRWLGDLEEGRVLSPDERPYKPAPPVIQFDSDGNVLQAWGGPNDGFTWPAAEHGLSVDHEGNIWTGGSIEGDHQVLKFSPDGTLLLEIGKYGETGGSNHTGLLGLPTEFHVDPDANEVYIADGYQNNRVIVFDAITGEYKRHWGAYGNKLDDSYKPELEPGMSPPQQFGGVVHAVVISNDGLVYVCDRKYNRIQVFRKNGEFVFESFIAPNTPGLGSAWDIDFSHDPEQKFVYLADGTNQCVWILDRENLEVIDKFGRIGRYAGQFIWLHSIATDSKGNIYTGEVFSGRRIQKFTLINPE